jgi:copper homeostasis protein
MLASSRRIACNSPMAASIVNGVGGSWKAAGFVELADSRFLAGFAGSDNAISRFNCVTTSPRVIVEVCVDSVASAIAAERGGAARVELCGSLSEGGTTPSAGLIETVRAEVTLPVHVMIRPRGGDFLYDAHEFETMRRDIALTKRLRAEGVVFGLLDIHGNVDVARTRELVDLARPLEVTFHRAFDMTADLFRALEDVCATGANRLLTSGGGQTSLHAPEMIAQFIGHAQSRIIVMPGSGIKPENARAFVQKTGAKEIHVGLRSAIPSPMQHQNLQITMGTTTGLEYRRFLVLEENVRKLCDALAGDR